MRASRLLQMLLLLQNRGRMSSTELSVELEVGRRTILRDVDALTEAGLPMIVHRGYRGGIELGFNYRTRLTGLSADEAEAIGVILSWPAAELAALGLEHAGERAKRKLLESFPDQVRRHADVAAGRFRLASSRREIDDDPRLPALATAVRETRVVRIQARRPSERVIHPVGLACDRHGWSVDDDLAPGAPIPLASCGDINVSATTFGKKAAAAPIGHGLA